jgi:hypothetical protein
MADLDVPVRPAAQPSRLRNWSPTDPCAYNQSVPWTSAVEWVSAADAGDVQTQYLLSKSIIDEVTTNSSGSVGAPAALLRQRWKAPGPS